MSTSSETEKDNAKPIKVNKWDGSAVKNALDDAIRDVFTDKLKYAEDYKLIDGRLVICAIAVGTALFALLWDYLHPFPESRSYLIYCVLFYFFMMGVLTMYVTYVEKGIFIVSIQRDVNNQNADTIWRLSSNLEKYSDQYQLKVACTNKKDGSRKEAALTKSIALFFDEEGTLVTENVEREIMKLHASLSNSKKNR